MGETYAAISTKDNPFNPFDDFNSWFLWDVSHGYNSCGKLARFSRVTDSMTEKEKSAEIERAIDAFLAVDFTKNYVKLKLEDDSPALSS